MRTLRTLEHEEIKHFSAIASVWIQLLFCANRNTMNEHLLSRGLLKSISCICVYTVYAFFPLQYSSRLFCFFSPFSSFSPKIFTSTRKQGKASKMLCCKDYYGFLEWIYERENGNFASFPMDWVEFLLTSFDYQLNNILAFTINLFCHKFQLL